MGTPSNTLEQLIQLYIQQDIHYPNLKPITIAQWILESGWGKSDLAQKHLNFAGMKWRDSMANYATKVIYKAHDGTAAYCHFDSMEYFIKGYWAFLERPPYKGWKSHTATGEDFIGFIGKIWAEDPKYIEKVLDLEDEAQDLLMKYQNDTSQPVCCTASLDLDMLSKPTVNIYEPTTQKCVKVY